MFRKLWNILFGKKKYDEISFRQGFDLTNLPIVTFYQNSNKFNFILDTGATKCVIDRDVLSLIEHEPVESTSVVYGFEGHKVETSACKIKLYYKDTEYSAEYVVYDLKESFTHIKKETGVTLHGIIGSLFFNKYRYVLDFDELIAYSKS